MLCMYVCIYVCMIYMRLCVYVCMPRNVKHVAIVTYIELNRTRGIYSIQCQARYDCTLHVNNVAYTYIL